MKLIDHVRVGHYQVGTTKTYSKLEAFELSRRLNVPYSWTFYEEVYSKFDWTTEPPMSIWELYSLRAKQIREEYDYVILFLSGGADSMTVLNSFAQNNLFIDEIVSVVSIENGGSLVSGLDQNAVLNSETFRAAIPLFNRIKKDYPIYQNTKHTFIDVQSAVSRFFKSFDSKDFLYTQNTMFTPTAIAKFDCLSDLPSCNEQLGLGKKVCILYGHDKPNFVESDGNLNFVFINSFDGMVSPRSLMFNRIEVPVVFFFSDPQFPLIPIKQSHLVKQFLHNPKLDNDFANDHPFRSKLQLKSSSEKVKFLSLEGLNRIIYPPNCWDPTTFSRGKPKTMMKSESDDWFFKFDTPERKTYLDGIKLLNTIYPVGVKKHDDIMAGILIDSSRPYYIGRLE